VDVEGIRRASGPSFERLFTELLETLPLGTAVFDRDMRYVAHNRAWLRAHGHDEAEDLTGKSHYDVFPGIREEWRHVHQRVLAGATEKRDLDTYEMTNGETAYLRWVVAPWKGAPGRIDGVIIHAENVTEHERTRRRLEERESLIRDLFEKSPVGLNLCTMDGLWLESNQAFCDIIGYTQAEADGGLTYWQLTPRKYDVQEQVQLEKLQTQRRYGPYEKEFRRKDGTLVPVRLNGFVVEREGQPFIWSLIEDLTAQRALEADLENERVKAIQSSKLAAVGEMAAGIAHELNNPLGIIDAYAFALEDARKRGDDAKVDENIRAIRAAVTRAGKIVRGLRKFTRESMNEPPEELDVTALVDESVALSDPRLREHGVAVRLEVASNARVRGRSIELGQVLVNLLGNAVDAVRGQDEKWVQVSVTNEAGGAVTIAVEDSGPGIPAEIAGDVFRAFFTTKKVGEGTGLGLSISRSIVERHGGTLTYEPVALRPRFVVRLPGVGA
jgi:PAS domain S-box-containing protein